MFGKYTPEAIKGISAERTQWAVDVIENNGGEVITSYILLGNHDLVSSLISPVWQTPFRLP